MRTIFGANWADGVYSKAIESRIGDYVEVPFSQNFNLQEFTVSLWFYPNNLTDSSETIIGKNIGGQNNWRLYRNVDFGNLELEWEHYYRCNNGTASTSVGSNHNYSLEDWHFVAFTIKPDGAYEVWHNGTLLEASVAPNFLVWRISNSWLLLGSFDGVRDDVHVFSRALSESEINLLYLQPTIVSFGGYFNFRDLVSGHSMLVDVFSDVATGSDPIFVTCTNFFVDARLVFVANGSARVNVWTILGEPLYFTGTWNSNNQTTTLLLDESGTGELSWIELEPSPSPTASPTPTPTPDQSSFFSTQNILIIAGVAAALILALVFEFKKGYIAIMVADDEESEDNEEIPKSKHEDKPEDDPYDYSI